MLLGPLLVAASMFAAQSTHHLNDPTSIRPEVQHNVVSVSGLAPAPRLAAPAPMNGELAPDFTYQSHDYLWQNLHNILEHSAIVLVFGAGDEQLLALEGERESMQAGGVTPVVVVDRRDLEAWSLVRRLSLGYSLLADPRSSIGEQYGVLDAASHRSQPAWFVIDQLGHVRGSALGTLPKQGWVELAAAALQPTPEPNRTASADQD